MGCTKVNQNCQDLNIDIPQNSCHTLMHLVFRDMGIYPMPGSNHLSGATALVFDLQAIQKAQDAGLLVEEATLARLEVLEEQDMPEGTAGWLHSMLLLGCC